MEGYSDSIATLRGQMIFPSRDATTVFRQWTTSNPFCCSHPKYEETKKNSQCQKHLETKKNTAQWGCPFRLEVIFSPWQQAIICNLNCTKQCSCPTPLVLLSCLLLLPLGHKSTHSSASTNFPQRKKLGEQFLQNRGNSNNSRVKCWKNIY